jgi:hypothetical protein
MSLGVCQPASSSSAIAVAAHAIAQTRSRGKRIATAPARITARSVWPLGNDVSNAAMWNEPL